MELSEAVKREAHRLGFELAGITTPDPLPHFDVFERWLEQGRHGEMAYLETPHSRERRRDPRNVLPECQAILVLGSRYPHPQPASREEMGRCGAYADSGNPPLSSLSHREMGANLFARGKGSGHIASYAWGDDYHDLLPVRMQKLITFIEQQTGFPVPHRIYTDTGPLLERELAQRAGLGWIGKNTCLIHPGVGSFFLLSEILLGIALQPDQPFTHDRCGSCRRCLEACPTGCIMPDRTIDARRCISYLTIELKGSVPLELRAEVGDWIFGCDICQQVCPWNTRFNSTASLQPLPDSDPIAPALQPRPGVPHPELTGELSLKPEAFNIKFRKSAVKRAKRRGYLRNVAIALGNTHPPGAEDALATSLKHDPEPLVRAHAAWALGKISQVSPIQNGQACTTLGMALEEEKDPMVLGEIKAALNTCSRGESK